MTVVVVVLGCVAVLVAAYSLYCGAQVSQARRRINAANARMTAALRHPDQQ